MKEYSYWGSTGEPPPQFKTTKQLAEIGLTPVAPVGIIRCKKYSIKLYDPGDINSAKPKRKPTRAQLEALATARESQRRARLYREWWQGEGRFLSDQNDAINWAKGLIVRDDWIILDTETTGFGDAEIVQVAVINPSGETILDSLVKPTTTIPDSAIAIHGINDEVVANAPTFPQVYPKIQQAINGKLVIIYNADFDTGILKYCCDLHNLPSLKITTECAMEWVAQYNGEWSSYYRKYKWVPLGGNHSALGDCLACLERLREIAQDSLIDEDAVFEATLQKT